MNQSRLALAAVCAAALSSLACPAALAAAFTATAKSAEPSPGEEAQFRELQCVAAVLTFQYDHAQTACSSAIALDPKSALGYKYRGMNYLLQHEFGSAEPDFLAAIKLDPKDAENQAGYAQSLSGQGRFAEAVKQFAVALKISPHDVRFLGASCWARVGEGKNLGKALAECNLSIKLDPEFAVGYDSRALVYLRQGHYSQSLQDYSRSLALVPDRSTALFGRGLTEIHLGQASGARRDIRLARLIDPEIDATFIQLGILSPDCREAGGACLLPDDLRPNATGAGGYISVAYRPALASRAIEDAPTSAFDP